MFRMPYIPGAFLLVIDTTKDTYPAQLKNSRTAATIRRPGFIGAWGLCVVVIAELRNKKPSMLGANN
ncbi:hypothetical protein [Aliidiomarina sedimenti]|uniref:hypothetical protein n=1 Tax=Aliidiomarina sedimenti TaxID=1933879 RepID=UPI000F8680F0|nr:hypothetical protein [Aliidiomarina sedimenti]